MLPFPSALLYNLQSGHRQCVLIVNRPPPSSKNPHFQNEARCTTFLVKMSFICMRMKNDFHIKGWAPTLVLKQRPGGTRKWPITATFGLKVDLWIISRKFLKFIVRVLSLIINSLGVLLSSFAKSIYNKVQIERASDRLKRCMASSKYKINMELSCHAICQ